MIKCYKRNILTILTLCFLLFLAAYSQSNKNKLVKPGIDVLLEDKIDLLKDKRVGLITNPTGVTSELTSTIDALNEHHDIDLVALFGPEHGVRGDVMAGEKIGHYIDSKTGIPVYSLYGKTRKPTKDMLRNIDVLIYDIQDIGSRAYTYIYTMAYAMEAAKENNVTFFVLDRPNPLGGELIEGPVLEPEFSSFIGLYPIPYIYGLTVGELALLFNEEFDINCKLTVVPMKGWERSMTFDDTGLIWVPTSPHIPHSDSPFYCATTGNIGELHSIDNGVGYTMPFELIGEEWIDGNEFAKELNGYNLPGVYFRPLYYKPYYFTNKDRQLQGVQIYITDFESYSPMKTQIYILTTLKKLYPEVDFFNTPRVSMFDKAMGTDKIRIQIDRSISADKIISSWDKDLKEFINLSKKYHLY